MVHKYMFQEFSQSIPKKWEVQNRMIFIDQKINPVLTICVVKDFKITKYAE